MPRERRGTKSAHFPVAGAGPAGRARRQRAAGVRTGLRTPQSSATTLSEPQWLHWHLGDASGTPPEVTSGPVSETPEPGTLTLMGLAAAGGLGYARRRRKAA